MPSSHLTALAVSLGLIGALAAPAAQAAPEFINGLALDGALLDKSGGTDANNGRVGYFSALYYDADRNQWWGLSDRGPGGGTLDYNTRVQRFRLKVDKKTGAVSDFKIKKTIIFKNEAGVPLNGLAPSPTNVLGNAFDPEGFVIGPKNHHFYVSDEYGPSLYEFDDKGRRVRTFATPTNLIPRNDAGMPNFAGTRFGVITRIATTPVQSPAALYGTVISGVHVNALAVHYDPAQWLDEFTANWPEGSAGHASYHGRITSGPRYGINQAMRKGIHLNPFLLRGLRTSEILQ